MKWRAQIGAASSRVRRLARVSDAEARIGIRGHVVAYTATGAEVVRLDRELTRPRLSDFIATLAANPAVEYVEEDR